MRADRLISLFLLLQAHGQLPAPELARRLEVSVRTVFRDMDALSAAGFPVYAERGRAGGCALLPGFRTDVSGLTAAEAQALFVLTSVGSTPAGQLGLSAPARSALRKVAAGLPPSVRPQAEDQSRYVVVDSSGWFRGSDPDRWLGTLRTAVFGGRRLRLRYAGSRSSGVRLVDPWGLVFKGGVWYLVAAHRRQPRMYRVSRVVSAAVLPSAAHRPAGLDLAAVWKELREEVERPSGEPVVVTLRVRAQAAPRVTRMCAPQLVPGDQSSVPDGDHVRIVLPFRALGAARGTLLGFGDEVEVLDPPALRTELARVAAQVVRLYADG
ncbi:helix-turn-helix transcriptional regulator [Cryptosporangium sp. NPDC051539]|uniref:helix-turn-helix transcriptional regulator n=1 Tax=Cryptosporangium sp. NPDC051539 TaxID=3363962 RepID=UPI00378B8B2D